MLNVKTLTDTMSRMELPQLQQYATLHKNDPYIVTLALSIANQKKQMRTGQDGQAGMMPQPKVADQQIAQMVAPPPQQMAQALPEDQGIGTLPAQNMQNFAGGGIVAFEEGGDVPGYAEGVFTGGTTARVGQLGYEQLVKLFQTDPDLARQAALRAGPAGQRFLANLPNYIKASGVPGIVTELGTAASMKANSDLSKMTPAQRASLYETPMVGALSGDASLAAAIQNAPDMEKPANTGYFDQVGRALSFIPKTLVSAPGDKDSPKGYGLTRLFADGDPAAASAAVTPAPAAAPIPYDPKTATRRSMFVDQAAPPVKGNKPRIVGASVDNGAPITSAAPSSAAPADPLAGITALNTKAMTTAEAKAEAKKLSDSARLESELKSNETFTTQAYEKLLGDYDKNIAKMPEAYKNYEARLKKEETEAATDKDKALGMAIFQAGLGMMGGTSQYAFENISKGALSGLDNYQSALKDLKKAQRERDKAFADIEAARLAEKRGDLRTQTELQAKGIEALGAAKNRTVEGIAKIFQVDTETAKGLFDTKFKEASQNDRTIFTTKAELQKQSMSDAAQLQRQFVSDTAAMQRIKEQVAGSIRATQINAETYKLPMLYKSVEDSVDKMLQADTNYRLADETTKTTMRNNALQKRLRATPGLAQYADATTGGGGAPGLRYNPQTGKIE
jgi:hypothetical protein